MSPSPQRALVSKRAQGDPGHYLTTQLSNERKRKKLQCKDYQCYSLRRVMIVSDKRNFKFFNSIHTEQLYNKVHRNICDTQMKAVVYSVPKTEGNEIKNRKEVKELYLLATGI